MIFGLSVLIGICEPNVLCFSVLCLLFGLWVFVGCCLVMFGWFDGVCSGFGFRLAMLIFGCFDFVVCLCCFLDLGVWLWCLRALCLF